MQTRFYSHHNEAKYGTLTAITRSTEGIDYEPAVALQNVLTRKSLLKKFLERGLLPFSKYVVVNIVAPDTHEDSDTDSNQTKSDE